MISHVTYLLVLVTLMGVSNGAIREWKVSSETYGSKCADVLASEYNATLKKVEAFKPKADACAVKVNTSVKACVKCMKKQSCSDDNMFAWMGYITYLGDPYRWGPDLEKGLGTMATSIASGIGTIYKKYGKSAIRGLKNGFDSIGGAFKSFGKIIGSGLKAAYNALNNALYGMFSKFPILGKRRRSVDTQTSIVDVPLVRERRSTFNLTSDEKKCMKKCSSCSSFTSGDEETAMRAICGDAVVNENITLTNDMKQLQSFYEEYQNATLPLLKTAWVNTSSGKVTKFIALKNGTYHTYYPANITLDLWDQDPTYTQIAQYMYAQYAVSS